MSSPNFFEESIINEIIEFKKVETAKPESINEELEELDANLDIRKTIKAAANPPINEKIGIIRIEYDAKPSDNIITAPTAAPEETPIIPGSAIGFLKIPWSDAPEAAKDAPTKIDKIILDEEFKTLQSKVNENVYDDKIDLSFTISEGEKFLRLSKGDDKTRKKPNK